MHQGDLPNKEVPGKTVHEQAPLRDVPSLRKEFYSLATNLKTLKVMRHRLNIGEVDECDTEAEIDIDLYSEHCVFLYLSVIVEKVNSLYQRHYARNMQFGFSRIVIHAVATGSLVDQASVDTSLADKASEDSSLTEKSEGRHGKHRQKCCAECGEWFGTHWKRHWKNNHHDKEVRELKAGAIPKVPGFKDKPQRKK